jgi:ABC-type glycerol-3-phosphate transport system substrate-binding protein
LNELAENDPAAKESLSDTDPALVKSVTVDDKFYLLPVAWNNMMIYYNTRVFEEAGIPRPSNDWTWEDFLEVAKKLTSGSGPKKRFGFRCAPLAEEGFQEHRLWRRWMGHLSEDQEPGTRLGAA